MNILEIIKKAPKDHVYYCTVFGYCNCSGSDDDEYPIKCDILSDADRGTMSLLITKDGKYVDDTPYAECVLFPSCDNRDWAAFERELDGKPEEKKPLFHSENESFDGSIEMVSIPDRPIMAAVIMSGMLACGGMEHNDPTLVNRAVHLADLILDCIKEDCK